MHLPHPRDLAEVLRATLSIMNYYGGSIGMSVTLPELKRTLQASITELELSTALGNAQPATQSQLAQRDPVSGKAESVTAD